MVRKMMPQWSQNEPKWAPKTVENGSKMASEIDPWGTIFTQKGSKYGVPQLGGSVLEPTWARFGAENVPSEHFH